MHVSMKDRLTSDFLAVGNDIHADSLGSLHELLERYQERQEPAHPRILLKQESPLR